MKNEPRLEAYLTLFCKNGAIRKEYRCFVEKLMRLFLSDPRQKAICVADLKRQYGFGYNRDNWDSAIKLCEIVGLKYLTRNDAPRGGEWGDVLIVNVDPNNRFFKDMAAGRIVLKGKGFYSTMLQR